MYGRKLITYRNEMVIYLEDFLCRRVQVRMINDQEVSASGEDR